MAAKKDEDPRGRLLELLGEFRTAMLVTRTADGVLRARPLSLAREHGDGGLYFATSLESPKVAELEASPEVVVTLQGSNSYLSISGTARVTRDRALVRRLWSEPWRVWFPDGEDDPTLCLVEVMPKEAEYWDQRGVKGIKYLLGMVKAYATGTTPASGASSDNAKVHFEAGEGAFSREVTMNRRRGTMTATQMLKEQHREVEELFKQLEETRSAEGRRRVFEQIADSLAVHATIEERHFYPGVKAKGTEDLLAEAVEEHLEIKRVIADLLELDADDDSFAAKAKVLQEDVEHHVKEEEDELFPKVEKLIDEETLVAIAEAMQETQAELLREGNPREAVPSETDHAAPI
jgi:general stress protein 26/hemerythrin-like domain-containing protein